MAAFYDCEFIDPPPESMQTECPVCLSVLQDPYQVDCCGYRFCRLCIEQVVDEEAPCPCCKSEEFDTYEDRRLRRSLGGLKVCCSNKKRGCEWEGELDKLREHLNSDGMESGPGRASAGAAEKLLNAGCPFMELKCLYCSNLFQRSKLLEHQNSLCPLRPTVCTYCDKYCSSNEDVTTTHWSRCAYYPINCSNECGKIMQRQDLAIHIATQCPLAEVDCDFKEAGCKTRLLRKDMEVHLDDNVVRHLSLMSSSHSKVLMAVGEHDNLLKNLIHSTERLQRKTVKLSQTLDTVNQNSMKLQHELSKRDEQITQHVKALQQQLVEETKKTRKDNAKLVKMVKQQIAKEKKAELERAHHKFPLPAVVVLAILSITLIFVVVQPVRDGCVPERQSQFAMLPVPVNLTMLNLSHHNGFKWRITLPSQNGAENGHYKMCISTVSDRKESSLETAADAVCFQMIPENCDNNCTESWLAQHHGEIFVEMLNFEQFCTDSERESFLRGQHLP